MIAHDAENCLHPEQLDNLALIKAFAAAIRGEGQSGYTIDDAIKSLQIIEAAHEAARTGQTVVLGAPQVVMSSVGPTPGWMPLKVEVALDLQGGETGGSYDFDLTFTAQVLP